ncbi:MAG: LptF/LptG family permease [Candidatus Hydrogenedens sp.]|nr:LptF/LptG family permease [Candidatus Hydrogenedens sp.]
MTLLSRHTLRQIAAPALMAALVIAFFVTGSTVRTQMKTVMELVPVGQIRVADISKISLFTMPMLSGYVFPITFLMGIMLAFSRMARDSELIAMKAAGIPLRRLVLPVVAAGALLSGAAFFIQDQAQPWAHRRLVALVTGDLPLRVSIDLLPTGVMHEFGDWRVYIGGRDPDGTLRGITVLQPDGAGGANAFYADAARLVHEDGKRLLEMRRGYLVPADPTRHFTFESLRQPVPAITMRNAPEDREGMGMRALLDEERRLDALFRETAALPVAGELRAIRLDIKNRLAFPLMCLAVALVAAPIGARSSKAGRSYTFAAGMLIIVVYFVLRKLVEPPFLASLPLTIALGQIPNLLLGAAGVALIARVDRV